MKNAMSKPNRKSISVLVDAAAEWIVEGAPSTWPCNHLAERGLRGLFFEGVPFKEKPTRVFAWLGLPAGASTTSRVPGVVLVHGGGGTAFARWVRWWNARGYAAIAMDTCGTMPLPETGERGSAIWPGHNYSGPICEPFAQAGCEPGELWVFHACACAVKAHSLLAALPEVDEKRIGVTGVSWGGFLTCLLAGIDPRFRCAAPVYGCGFLGDESVWSSTGEFAAMSESQQLFWRDNFDPSSVLPRVKIPMLWLNGTNDFAFWPPVWQKSAAFTSGPRQLCMKVRWPHGHIPAAEQAREIEQFFQAQLAGGLPLVSISPPQVKGSRIKAAFGDERPVRSASLAVTVDRGLWPEREWHILPAALDAAARQVTAIVPDGATAAYLELLSDDWLTSTSDIVFC